MTLPDRKVRPGYVESCTAHDAESGRQASGVCRANGPVWPENLGCVGLSQDNSLTDLEAPSAEPGQGNESIAPPTAEYSFQPAHQGTSPEHTGSCLDHPTALLTVALEWRTQSTLPVHRVKPWAPTSQGIQGTVMPDLGTKHQAMQALGPCAAARAGRRG